MARLKNFGGLSFTRNSCDNNRIFILSAQASRLRPKLASCRLLIVLLLANND